MTEYYDYLVIGAGPAGLQLGYFLQKNQRKYLILEKGESAGTFFKTKPVHRKLISINKVHTGYEDTEINLRWDWNSLLSDDDKMLYKEYSKEYFPPADGMVDYLRDFARHFELNVRYNTDVIAISKDGNFSVTDAAGKVFESRYLVMATGVSEPYIPDIDGGEFVEQYVDLTLDKSKYINKRVLILGKGNSAFETADYLVDTAASIHLASPTPLKMAWRSHFVGHLRAVNNNLLDTYHLKSQNAVLDADLVRIEKHADHYEAVFNYNNDNREQEHLEYDHIIGCTGFRFDNSMFDDSCKPGLSIDDRFPTQTSEWESVNVRNLYFAGTVTQVRDFKKYMSGFIHGFRYNVQALANILNNKNHSVPMPGKKIELQAEQVTDSILQRVNRSSSIWQQPGFLCDAIIIAEQDDGAHYYPTVPTDYVHEVLAKDAREYLVVTLEFGESQDPGDHSSQSRINRTDYEKANLSKFLHPIIRYYAGGEFIAEHHVIEDLAAEWKEPEHINPLKQFLAAHLSPVPDQAEVLAEVS